MAMHNFYSQMNNNNNIIIMMLYTFLQLPVNSLWLRLADVAVISRGRLGFGEVCAVYTKHHCLSFRVQP